MQQYLFRGLTADNKWVYGSLIQRVDGIGKLSLIEVQSKDGEITVHQVKDDSVGMWTGLTDVNGVKIFAGDLYHTNVSKQDGYQVMFISGAFVGGTNDRSCSPLGWQPDGSGDDLMLDKTETWLIVVGSIHEVNPADGNVSINNMLDPKEQAAEGQEQAVESAAQDTAMEVTESAEEGSTEG
jgi:hypothetical protein